MTDLIWVISSSVLILAVIAIRAIFGKRMSAGFRYALWALVLLRLLIPGTVFSSPVSVESAVLSAPVVGDMEKVRGVSSVSMSDGVVTGKLSYPRPASQTNNISPAVTAAPVTDPAAPPAQQEEASQQVVIAENATREQYESIKRTVEARTVLNIVWLSGMGLMAAWFVFTNARMYLTLKKRRVRLDVEAPCPVYSVEDISSSCLFVNSIYVSKETAENEAELKNVLAHELAHRRHGDGLTVFLRGIALVIHWYNPLVWAAALLSRRDGEVFADAGAIKALGEDERENYGLTLIGLSTKLKKRVGLCTAATTMTGGKRELKERITHMAKNKKTKLIIAAAVTALALAAVAFCFLGCKSSNPPNGKTNGPDKLFTYFIDIDHDGEAEEFTVDLEALGTEGHASPFITKNGEEIIRLDEFGTSHAGMVSYAHTELDGSDYILRYAPYLGGGTFSIGYELLELRNGELSVKEQDSFRIDNTGNEGMETAAERGAALIERVNELWNSSKLMISTDSFTLMRSGLYNIADGTPFVSDGANVIAFSDHQLFTPEKGSRIVSFGEPVSYKEKLVVIDDLFTDLEDYHSAMTIAQKLEYFARFLAPEPTETPADGWVLDYTKESEYYAYMQAAADLLTKGTLTSVYTCDAYFHLDDDALRAYAKYTVLHRKKANGVDEYSFEYSEPIAEYPREVGELALNRLYNEVAWLDYVGPYTGAEGFVGDDWFVLKTVDDSMQDIQFSVIFHREGNEWHEFGDNNSQQDRPLFGACIVDENVGFLSYFTKFYDQPDGSYRKIWLYRTDDGGRTWVDMGLEIPEEYGNCYPGYAASPVFDGDHGVMQVCAFGLGSSGEETQYKGLWYETFDGGLTWTLREGDTAAEPTPAPTAIPDPEALRLSLLPNWPTNNIDDEWVHYSGVNAATLRNYVNSRIADGFTLMGNHNSRSKLLIRGGTWIEINDNTGVDSSCEIMVTFDSPTEGVDRALVWEAIRNADYSVNANTSAPEGELYDIIEITPQGFYEASGLMLFRAAFDNSASASSPKYQTRTLLTSEDGALALYYRDVAAADIDGDGVCDVITLDRGPTSGLFSVVFKAYGVKDGRLMRFAISGCVIENYGLDSLSSHDGKPYYVWEEQIITPGDPYNATYGEPKEFELTLEDGKFVIDDPDGLLKAGPMFVIDY